MANRFAGTCYKCGKVVLPGKGVFEKISAVQVRKWPNLDRSVRWLTQHHECVRNYSQNTHYLHNPHSQEPQ